MVNFLPWPGWWGLLSKVSQHGTKHKLFSLGGVPHLSAITIYSTQFSVTSSVHTSTTLHHHPPVSSPGCCSIATASGTCGCHKGRQWMLALHTSICTTCYIMLGICFNYGNKLEKTNRPPRCPLWLTHSTHCVHIHTSKLQIHFTVSAKARVWLFSYLDKWGPSFLLLQWKGSTIWNNRPWYAV